MLDLSINRFRGGQENSTAVHTLWTIMDVLDSPAFKVKTQATHCSNLNIFVFDEILTTFKLIFIILFFCQSVTKLRILNHFLSIKEGIEVIVFICLF